MKRFTPFLFAAALAGLALFAGPALAAPPTNDAVPLGRSCVVVGYTNTTTGRTTGILIDPITGAVITEFSSGMTVTISGGVNLKSGTNPVTLQGSATVTVVSALPAGQNVLGSVSPASATMWANWSRGQTTQSTDQCIVGGVVSGSSGGVAEATQGTVMSPFVPNTAPSISSNAASTVTYTAPQYQMNKSTAFGPASSSPYQSANMSAQNNTATGFSGNAQDVRSVGAAGFGTNFSFTLATAGATITADSTWAGGNDLDMTLDPSSAASEYWVSTVSIQDAKANGFPVSENSADQAVAANAGYVGKLHKGNLNIKVGDNLYIYAGTTGLGRGWITQTR